MGGKTGTAYGYTGQELANIHKVARLECKVETLEAQIKEMREDHSRLFCLAGRLLHVAKAAMALPRNRVFATTKDLALFDALDTLHVGDLDDTPWVQDEGERLQAATR